MKTIDTLVMKFGVAASFIVFFIPILIAIEVVCRSAFGSPTIWVHETVQLSWGVYIVFAGAYTLLLKKHIRIDLIYIKFNAKLKILADVLDMVLFFALFGTVLWKGWEMAYRSILIREHSATVFNPPIYPFKVLIVVAALLMLVEGLHQLLKYRKVG